MSILDIRHKFATKLATSDFVTDKTGAKTIEIVGSSFEVNGLDDHIFGAVNSDYIERELQWYRKQSLFVKDLPGKVPEIWLKVADRDGKINSNYGYLVWSYENFHQYQNTLNELRKNPDSRRAIMIYTRPSMHYDYNRNGMSDFVCTNTVQYVIRDGKLNAIVNMRSNDAIFGFRNDLAWQRTVLNELAADLNVPAGQIYWQTGSLHVYERHFYLVHWYSLTGETTVTKEAYLSKYPDSPYGK